LHREWEHPFFGYILVSPFHFVMCWLHSLTPVIWLKSTGSWHRCRPFGGPEHREWEKIGSSCSWKVILCFQLELSITILVVWELFYIV